MGKTYCSCKMVPSYNIVPTLYEGFVSSLKCVRPIIYFNTTDTGLNVYVISDKRWKKYEQLRVLCMTEAPHNIMLR